MTDCLEKARKIAAQRYPGAAVCLAAGSLVRGQGTKYSDIDLVVLYGRLPHARRESFLFEETPVEAFIHDPETAAYFMREIDRRDGFCFLARMISEGVPFPRRDPVSDRMKSLAERVIEEGPPDLTPEDLRKKRYVITDLVDDIREPRSAGELSASGAVLYGLLADFFLRCSKRWSAKGKWIPRTLGAADPGFSKQFISGFDRLFQGDPLPVIRLCESVLEIHGGPLFDGFAESAPESFRSKGS